MDDLDNQTEEALGWAAEGKKLAVDIPEVSFKDAATFVASATPIIGDAMAAKEVYDELQKDEPNYYLAGALGGAALVGLVPGLGDAAAKAIKKGAREVFDAGKRLTSKTPSKIKPSYTDAELLEADDIIDEWAKGNLTNTELRNQMRDKGFPIETKRISPKSTGDDLEVVSPDGNIIPWKDMPRGLDVPSDVRYTFNQGGAVVDEQMEMAFGDQPEVDPVSGNEVPTGSLPEEVRDDIPAQLSEGEYVVPADVVRFFGVKFFEDIRAEAKQGFAAMEANGRIGGEPIGMEMGGDELPFDISELQIVEDGEPEQPMMNKGGYISGYAPGGLVDTGDIPLTEENYQGTGMEQRQYSNAAGNIITILFFNGMPMSAVPDGYSPYTPEAVPSEAKEAAPSDDDSSFDPSESDLEPIDYKGLSAAELRDLVDAQKDTSSTTIALGLAMVNPLIGMAFKAATWHQSKQVTKELARRMEDPSLDAKQKAFYTDLTETMTADQPGLFERLFGKTEEAKKPEVAPTAPPPVMTPEAVQAAMTDTPGVTEPYSYTPEAGWTPGVTAAETAEVKAANDALKASPVPRTTAQLRKDKEDDTFFSTKSAISRSRDIQKESEDTGRSIAEIGRESAPSTEPQSDDDKAAEEAGATRGAGGQRGMNKGGLMKKKKK